MADPIEEPPHPRETYDLDGHEAAEAEIAEAIASGRMHHAWLIHGPRGVGKATLAWRAARRLLGAAPDLTGRPLSAEPDDPVCRRMEADAHSDLIVLERPAKTQGGLKAEIPVDAARKVGRFFTTTAGEGGWRVCLVDAADELNVNAANALLKTLEEPPPRCVLLLVAHARGRVPVTVRSRCRALALTPPGEAAAARVVHRLTDADAATAKTAAALAEGRPGEAVRIALADGADLHHKLQALWTKGGDGRVLAEQLARPGADALRALFFSYARAHVRTQAHAAAGQGSDAVEAWGAAWDQLRQWEDELVRLHMDPKATILQAMAHLQTLRPLP